MEIISDESPRTMTTLDLLPGDVFRYMGSARGQALMVVAQRNAPRATTYFRVVDLKTGRLSNPAKNHPPGAAPKVELLDAVMTVNPAVKQR